MSRCCRHPLQGKASHALWQAWALMEQRQGDRAMVRPLFRRGLEVSPRSRYTHLSWALWEKEEGNVEEARRLFKSGVDKNPRDTALLQVGWAGRLDWAGGVWQGVGQLGGWGWVPHTAGWGRLGALCTHPCQPRRLPAWLPPQAWALLEEEEGAVEEARALLRRASRVDASHLYVWQAWGCLEYRQGQYDTARELFQQGIWSAPPRDPSVSLVFQVQAAAAGPAGRPCCHRPCCAAVLSAARAACAARRLAAHQRHLPTNPAGVGDAGARCGQRAAGARAAQMRRQG